MLQNNVQALQLTMLFIDIIKLLKYLRKHSFQQDSLGDLLINLLITLKVQHLIIPQ